MKFYIVKEAGVTLGCVRTLKAVKLACQRLEAPGVLEVEVNAVRTKETIIV